MDELSSSDVSVIEDDSLDRWKGPTLVEPYLKEATFEELCNDDAVSYTHLTLPTRRIV